MKLLLIGHGYLGHAVTRLFAENGWETQAVSLSGGDDSIACCVGNADQVNSLPDADLVVHCASSGRGSCDRTYQRVYVDGCRNLVHRYSGVPIIFTSSTSVYGQTHGEIVTEACPADPDRERGQLLLNAEHSILDAGGAVARLSGIYGPGRSALLRKFLAGEAQMDEDGKRYLNHIHRDDAARAVYHIAENKLSGIYNVTDSYPLHQADCYKDLCRMFKRPVPPSGPRDLNRKRGWTNKRVSNAKLRATGWVPHYPSFVEAAQEIAGTLEVEVA